MILIVYSLHVFPGGCRCPGGARGGGGGGRCGWLCKAEAAPTSVLRVNERHWHAPPARAPRPPRWRPPLLKPAAAKLGHELRATSRINRPVRQELWHLLSSTSDTTAPLECARRGGSGESGASETTNETKWSSTVWRCLDNELCLLKYFADDWNKRSSKHKKYRGS